MNEIRWLTVRGNGDCKVTSRFPNSLRNDEITFKLRIYIPDGWGHLSKDEISVTMPEPPEILGVSEYGES